MKDSHRRFFAGLLLATLFVTPSVYAQSDEPLPFDPQVKVETLDNGFTYYIRENKEPENRAAFRLVVNAGSILEKEETKGLAHFLEHLAFNGTNNFEKQELVKFIESIGMQFGADLNAYTSFDETVYMLEIPMDDDEILATTFQILEDWAHQITFDPEEIEKERGVVLEEWRLRLGARNRLSDKQLPVLFHNSMYAERLPIGDPEIIKTVDQAAFLDFYQNYYRPDLMALIAVGDFESGKIEALIHKHFAHIKNPPNAPPRTAFPVPSHDETLFSITTDPELSSTSISINYKRNRQLMRTESDYRQSLVDSLYSTLLNGRLRERGQQKNPPYLRASSRKRGMARPVDTFTQNATVEEGKFAEGLKALLAESKRALTDGFTQQELQRAKANRFRSMQQAYRERDQRSSSRHAGELANHFLEQEASPGIEYEFELTKKLLATITLEEVNRAADDWITTSNRVILYSAPEKDGVAAPTEEEILAVIEEADQIEIESYEEADLSDPLMTSEPKPGRVVSEIRHDSTDVTEWILSNDIRVILKPTDFKKDQVLFSAYSPGGTSLVDNEDFVPAMNADSSISRSGLGKYSSIELRKKLAGKQAQARPSIGGLYENLSGAASPEDLETLFQIIHMRFTEPRTDEDVFGASLTQLRSYVKNRLNNPGQVFADTVEKKLYNDHPRHQPIDEDYIEAMDLERSFEIYKDRFADASDFTFIFVGAFNLVELRPLIEMYLASLPDLDREEIWRDNGDDPIQGQNEVTVHRGLEPKSSVSIQFYGDANWSYMEAYVMRAMIDVLKIPMREALREDKGGVYGVGVSGGLTRYPKEEFGTGISFGCDPANVDELIQTAYQVIEKLKSAGPREKDLESVKEMHIRGEENNLRQNSFWSGVLSYYATNDLDFGLINTRANRARALTAKMIQEAAVKYFDDTHRFVAKLLPEEIAGGE